MTLAPQTVIGWRKDGRPIRVIAGGDNTASPSPQAESSPTPSTVDVGGFHFTAPTGSGSTSGSLYGLGNWGGQTIDVSGFPMRVVIALSNAGIDTSKPVKADDIAKALGSIHDTQAVAQLQQMLYWGGFYTDGTKLSDLQLGSFGDKDTSALANAVVTAGRTAQQLGTYLSARANTGYAQGIVNQAAGTTTTPITRPSQIDEDAALRQAAHNLLGREPNAQDIAGFRAWYDNAYEAGQKAAQKLQAQQQAAQLPDATTLGGALGRLGQGFTDAAETPPATLPGLPASQMRNPDFAGTNAFHPTNPALAQFNAQQAQDLQTVGQVGSALQPGAAPVLTDAPNIGDAAEEYLREHEAAAVGQQNVATKYAQFLQMLTGSGA